MDIIIILLSIQCIARPVSNCVVYKHWIHKKNNELKFLICKYTDEETYYQAKRDIPNFKMFVREQLGWNLFHTENLLKLEKRPEHTEVFMGIGVIPFSELIDYVET